VGHRLSANILNKLRERVVRALNYYPYLDSSTTAEVRTIMLSANEAGIYIKLKSSSYGERYINIYLDFVSSTVSVLVEDSLNVR